MVVVVFVGVSYGASTFERAAVVCDCRGRKVATVTLHAMVGVALKIPFKSKCFKYNDFSCGATTSMPSISRVASGFSVAQMYKRWLVMWCVGGGCESRVVS